MDKNLICETNRLILRPFEITDLEDLAAVYGDAEVMRYIGTGSLTIDETRKKLIAGMDAWRKHGFGAWAIICRTTGQFIGRTGLAHLDGTTDVHVGFVLDKRFWHRGLGYEAAIASISYGFETLKLDKIFAAARATNTSSRRLLEKLGMTFARDASYYGHAAVIYVLANATFTASCARANHWVRPNHNYKEEKK